MHYIYRNIFIERIVVIVKRLLVCVLATAILLFGCSAGGEKTVEPPLEPPSAPEQSTGHEEALPPPFADMSGKALDTDDTKQITFGLGADVADIELSDGWELDYALGWNFDNDGYTQIKKGDVIGGLTITEASSIYYIDNFSDALTVTFCGDNRYTADCGGTISGVIKTDGNSLILYPYNIDGNNFLFLCERDESGEDVFNALRYLRTSDRLGYTLVQPVGIVLQKEGDLFTKDDIASLGLTLNAYYNADVKVETITSSAECHGYASEIFGTRTWATVKGLESITISDLELA